jgi:hypothetical protein
MLSGPAQQWYNSAVDAFDENKEFPDFPDFVDAAAEVAEDDDEVNNDEEVAEVSTTDTTTNSRRKTRAKVAKERPAAPARAAKVARAVKATAAPRKKVVARATPGVDGARVLIMRKVISDPKINNKELIEYVRQKGSPASPLTVSAIRSQIRQMVGILKEESLLKQSFEV